MRKFETLYEAIIGKNIHIQSRIIEAALFFESDGVLEEGFFHDSLKKLGLHVKKGDGLVQMVAKSGIQVGKVLIAAYKAAKTGSDEDKAKLKTEIENSKVSKGQFLDFLLKLDTATLHLVTGPIHMIDAIMGWHIWADVEDSVKDVSKKIVTAIQDIKHHAVQLGNAAKAKIETFLKSIEQIVTA